ncbi:MAG: UDP-2,3-diacylglucosamine diphosphatase [Gemmatimonadetes bacterium]|nr:UDP-2,3-diacylglucosamine diphosphatase [Gemmatimonadota bacterium]
MSVIYFLSDAHLGGDEESIESRKRQDLVAFLGRLRRGDRLYLLGDVFDFWFDFGTPPPADQAAVLAALEEATRRGVGIAFMGGNHDHWARTTRHPGYLETIVGLELIDDPHTLVVDGMRLLLCHGDALGGARGTYRIIRAVLHHPASIFGFRLLGPRIGRWLAARTSTLSRRSHQPEAQVVYEDRLRSAAREVLSSGRYEAVVAGHIHRPELLTTDNGVYLNLGDWIEHRTYGRLESGKLTLEDFDRSGHDDDS